MKKFKILLSIMIVAIIISCGGKSNNKEKVEETDKKDVVVTDCNCSEVLTETNDFNGFKKKGSKDLYTGTCVEKDQYDSIIQKTDFKNGWLIKDIKKMKINNEYVQTDYTEYENGEIINNWSLKFSDYDDSNLKLKYTSEYDETKNIKTINKWSFSLDYRSGDKIIGVRGINSYKNGEDLDNFDDYEKSMPKSFPNPEYFMDNWSQFDISPEERDKILANLKKELPQFNYWKIK